MKILVIGSGAIGAFYGAKLAQAGAQVSTICRSDYEEVKKHGFHITSHLDQESFTFKPKYVLKHNENYEEEADFLLVATKVLPDINLKQLIKPYLSKNTSIILLQNGIHIEKTIQKSFPNHNIISGLAFICVSKTKSGTVNHQDYGRLVIGDYPQGLLPKTQKLVDLFNQTNIQCQISDNIKAERWKKLIWNAPFNPLSVIKNQNTQEILDNPQTKTLVQNIMQEVLTLAKADDCELDPKLIEKNISMTQVMKPYKTSMLLDSEARRPLEIEAILGNAIRFAQEKSIEVPNISNIYSQLQKFND